MLRSRLATQPTRAVDAKLVGLAIEHDLLPRTCFECATRSTLGLPNHRRVAGAACKCHDACRLVESYDFGPESLLIVGPTLCASLGFHLLGFLAIVCRFEHGQIIAL